MASCRDLFLLPVIVCLLLMQGFSSLPTTSDENTVKPLGPRGFSNREAQTDDYDLYYDTTVAPKVPTMLIPSSDKPPERCNYNPCLEDQIPCTDLSAATGCLCRGVTLHSEVPLPPDLKSVSWNGSEVVVTWCAPYSYVTAYVVKVGGEHKHKFGKDQRSGGLGDVEGVALVCVVAVNDAGNSKESCIMYQPGDSSLPLKAGLIGGALGLLLLLLLGVLLWRHRRQRKQEASISMHDAAETQ